MRPQVPIVIDVQDDIDASIEERVKNSKSYFIVISVIVKNLDD